jgi:transcriptional regulator with XRE-family HTH domain
MGGIFFCYGGKILKKLFAEKLATALAEAAHRKGFSQVELASRIGSQQHAVSRYFAEATGLAPEKVARLCDILKVAPLIISPIEARAVCIAVDWHRLSAIDMLVGAGLPRRLTEELIDKAFDGEAKKSCEKNKKVLDKRRK